MLDWCEPARVSLLQGPAEVDSYLREQLQEISADLLTPEKSERLLQAARIRFLKSEPVSKRSLDLAAFQGVPIFAADDVALYVASLPLGTDFRDVVASMAPPFNRFFIEFQSVPNQEHLYAWGALITVADDPKVIQYDQPEEDKPRWILELDTFFEREKSRPFGPVSTHYVGLAEDGTWFHHTDGSVFWAGSLTGFDPSPPEDIIKGWGDLIAQLLFPVLLTISFLHCKNVRLRTVAPPARLSHKHRKKRGRDLVRYHVLDIEPMRQLLERYRTGARHDLRRALHICRGHFKTFTLDAPLLGRHTGTYWWAPQVRGSKGAGVVLKDYRVRAPSDFGRAYHEADENPPEAFNEVPASKDPDGGGRGLVAHNQTQNKIAGIVRSLGFVARSPAANEPDFDVAWKAEATLFVCEVKSLLPTNEERQLRMGVGQVIRYRQKLAAAGHEPVTAVLATERPPQDPTWGELCAQENIVLIWPEVAAERIRGAADEVKSTQGREASGGGRKGS